MKKIGLIFYFSLFTCWCCYSQNVGIGTTNPAAKLHVTGSLRFDTLSGNGVRAIYADASGNVTATVPSLPPSTVTNSSGSAIPDFSCAGTGSNIVLSQLPTSVSSSAIKVTLNITHPKLLDLTIYLTAPNGAVINLFSGTYTSAADLTNTVFTDQGIDLSSGIAPYTGYFKPAGILTPNICGTNPTVATFSGMGGGTINPNGTWTLKVIDNTSTNTGNLNNWTLSINPGTGLEGIWGLKGNAGTNTNNFIGTVDNAPLNFRVNNRKAGIIDSTLSNTSFGFRSLELNTYGYANTAIGNAALFSNVTGTDLVAVGDSALFNQGSGLAGNTALGSKALRFNSGGYLNTATGTHALTSNTGGYYNTAGGAYALYNNVNGIGNTSTGSYALYSNIFGGYNTAAGHLALTQNTNGDFNTATGAWALNSNIIGIENTATGTMALNFNKESYNTAVGAYVLYNTNFSQYNTAIGYRAGDTYNNGYNNVFVGANTDVNGTGYFNVVAVGQGTVIGGSNTARFGNSATVSYGGWAGWTNVSDGRYKRNIQENVPGLAFINKLRPVTYNLDATSLDAFLHQNNNNEMKGASMKVYENALKEKEKIVYTGFVAQEVEAAAKELGFDFSGVDKPKSENDTYGLRYAEFVVPLVKAVQEQQLIIEKQQKQIEELLKRLEAVEKKASLPSKGGFSESENSKR